MHIKYFITGLVMGICLTGAAYARTYLVLPDDTTQSGASAGDSDFINGFDGLDTQVKIAEELAGDGSGSEIPLEFAIATDTANEWASGAAEAIVVIDLVNGSFTRTITPSDVLGIGACTAQATGIESGGVAGDSSVSFRIDNISLCDDTVISPTGPDGGATAADALTSALSFAFPVALTTGRDFDFSYVIVNANTSAELASGALSTQGYDDRGEAVGTDLFSTEPAFIYEFENITELPITKDSGYRAFDYTNGVGGPSANAVCGVSLLIIKTQGALKSDFVTPVKISDLDKTRFTFEVEDTAGFGYFITWQIGISYYSNSRNSENTLDSKKITRNIIGGLNDGGYLDDPPLLNDRNEPILYTHPICLSLNAEGTVPIQTQDVSITYELDFGDEAFTDPDNLLSTTIRMQREDEVTPLGRFEWVGDSNRTAKTIFRITGIGGIDRFRVSVENATGDIQSSEAEIALADLVNERGNVIITSEHLTEALGDFGRADVTIGIPGTPAEAENITVRRLLQSSTGAITEMSVDYSVDGINID